MRRLIEKMQADEPCDSGMGLEERSWTKGRSSDLAGAYRGFKREVGTIGADVKMDMNQILRKNNQSEGIDVTTSLVCDPDDVVGLRVSGSFNDLTRVEDDLRILVKSVGGKKLKVSGGGKVKKFNFIIPVK